MDEKLINIISEISTDKLRHTSHSKYVGKIFQVMSEALKQDGASLILLIESIKSCPTACYKRDLLLDVLSDIVTSEEILTNHLLCKPFENNVNKNVPWKELANAIATIPDLVANCGALTRYPQLNGHLFYSYILDKMYNSIARMLEPSVTPIAAHSTDTGASLKLLKMYYVQLLGRVGLFDQDLVWSRFTFKAIKESREYVRSFISSLIQLPTRPDPSYETLELFIDRLCMPILFNLKPSKSSGDQIYSLIGPGIRSSEHLLYLICDKNIFKTNHNLDKSKQVVILFNISAYLASLVNHESKTTLVNIDSDGEKDNEYRSLLITTLIEIARNWASSTKVLLRSYEHSRYITTALVIMFRYALKHENKSLAEHASEILSIIAGAIPTYLNRASQDHRNLAICLGELLLPELRKLMTIKREGNEVSDQKEFQVDWCVDYTDDLLYMKRLFQQEIEEIFHDYSGDNDVIKSESSYGQDIALKSAKSQSANNSNCSLDGKKPDKIGASSSNGKKIFVRCLGESYDDKFDAAAEDNDDDDLKPYVVSEEERDNSDEDVDDDDDDYELGEDAAHVPIYLRDCVDGLIENNNHRYVRLCLEKAGELIDQSIDQDSDTRDKQLASQRYNRTSACIGVNSQTQTDCVLDHGSVKSPIVNDTISDVGVELSRALLYLENQFNIDGFNAYRLNALTSLCCAAPQLVAGYLIEELNQSNRSIQQQLDILHVLVASARRLSGSPDKSDPNRCKQKKSKVSSKDATKHREQHVNKFTQFVSLYFYGLVYRLKADFVDNKLLITPKPETIMSAFRELKCHSVDTEGIQQILPRTRTTTRALSTTTVTSSKSTTSATVKDQTKVAPKQSSANTLINTGSDDNDVSDKFLERNSLSDDSYLLSRILLTAASVLGCSSQQLVVGKLANDLLDILAAYRCHPDPGVQKALVCCLKVIKDSTPGVYYENFIERRMLHLFAPWLASIQ